MYGGHITDKWDRRTNSTYLEVLLQDQLLQANSDVIPQFPTMLDGTFLEYLEHITEKLPLESPTLFGLHPNAEVGFLNAEASSLFTQYLELSGGASSGGGAAERDAKIESSLESILEKCPEEFNMFDLNQRIQEKTPFIVVCLQECERMNGLVGEIRRSLQELKLGLEGALNISDAMEALGACLFINKVPASWEKVAYPSLKSLGDWYPDLLERFNQLSKWQETLTQPGSVWISALFNPMAYVTAVMQTMARLKDWPLDNVCIQTNIMEKGPEAFEKQPEDGAYIHGLYMEGARWDISKGKLQDSLLKELHPVMPVVHVIAIPIEEQRTTGFYECPVYYTSQRGPTFTFAAQLTTDEENFKWVLAGVALLMSVED